MGGARGDLAGAGRVAARRFNQAARARAQFDSGTTEPVRSCIVILVGISDA
jgi:hypothetical protein